MGPLWWFGSRRLQAAIANDRVRLVAAITSAAIGASGATDW
jgi:hypothetical protein